MRAIVTGMIATYPVGGVVWDYAQYVLGLEQLGFEVYYLEDAALPTYDPVRGAYGEDCSYGVAFLARSLEELSPGLGGRWHFRAEDGRTSGWAADAFARLVAKADLFLNVSGGCLLRNEYMACPRKVLIDTDPGWNHFVNYPRWDANPGWQGTHGYRAHDYFFTYAERLGRPDCPLPDFELPWRPTRPPVVLDRWRPAPPGERWSTVMTWDNFRRPLEHAGVSYGTKEREFGRIERLPALTEAPLEVAVGGAEAPRQRWRDLGWSVVDAPAVSHTAAAYHDYVAGSRGELSVAKNVYVATRCGWFSCRSVCYLAAARPVVIQDTGFSEVIPTGHGLFAFSDLETAADALTAVESSYGDHQEAARALACRHFDSGVVLGEMLAGIGLG